MRRAQNSANENCPLATSRLDQRNDQVPGYDEEDIDPDEAAAKARNSGVIGDNRYDRESPQAIDETMIAAASNSRRTAQTPTHLN